MGACLAVTVSQAATGQTKQASQVWESITPTTALSFDQRLLDIYTSLCSTSTGRFLNTPSTNVVHELKAPTWRFLSSNIFVAQVTVTRDTRRHEINAVCPFFCDTTLGHVQIVHLASVSQFRNFRQDFLLRLASSTPPLPRTTSTI